MAFLLFLKRFEELYAFDASLVLSSLRVVIRDIHAYHT